MFFSGESVIKIKEDSRACQARVNQYSVTLSETFVFELLPADGGFVHQATADIGEYGNTPVIIGVS